MSRRVLGSAGAASALRYTGVAEKLEVEKVQAFDRVLVARVDLVGRVVDKEQETVQHAVTVVTVAKAVTAAELALLAESATMVGHTLLAVGVHCHLLWE